MAVCCLCERPVARWLPYPNLTGHSPFMAMVDTVGSDLHNFQCPHCGCIDRDRHLWLYLLALDVPRQLPGASMLHLAPELALERIFVSAGLGRYERGDLYPQRPEHRKLDAQALPFDDGSFDIIIANHLLEHVHDPRQVLAEFARCLMPGGLLLAQTPYSPRLKYTFELNGLPDPGFAHAFFGQHDHVRLFGSDIAGYFHAAGLQGDLVPHEAVLPDMDPAEFGCNAQEPLFAFTRPVKPG